MKKVITIETTNSKAVIEKTAASNGWSKVTLYKRITSRLWKVDCSAITGDIQAAIVEGHKYCTLYN